LKTVIVLKSVFIPNIQMISLLLFLKVH